jgi:hypothetical protein
MFWANELTNQPIRYIAVTHDIATPAGLVEMGRRTWEEVWE